MKGKQETARVAYKDADENVLGYVIRLENRQGDKITPTLTYCRNEKGEHQWRWKGFGEDRPLYGLEQLAQKPEARVLVVEGEKTAEAAKALFPDYAVVTWSGGCGAVNKSDWAVLKDREVVIWPDNDKAGHNAAIKIEEILKNFNGKVWHLEPDTWNLLPHKWDLADKLPEEWNSDRVKNLVISAQNEPARISLNLEEQERRDSIRTYLREEVRLEKHFWLNQEQISYFLKDVNNDPYEALRKWQYVSEDDSFKPMTQAEKQQQEHQMQQPSAQTKNYLSTDALQNLQSGQQIRQGDDSIQQVQRTIQNQQDKQRDADAVRFIVLSQRYQELSQARPYTASNFAQRESVEKAMKDLAVVYEKDDKFAKTLERFGDKTTQKIALDFLKNEAIKREQNQLTPSQERGL
jgi:DNA primase